MNILSRNSSMSFGAIIALSMLLFVTIITAVSGVTHAGSNGKNENGRLITIHDRGNSTVILTHAMTVGDALKEANIGLDSKDAVEPSLSQELVSSDYQINIYRARPVLIIDGGIRTKIITPYQTVEQIADSSGIKLYDEDMATLTRTTDIIADGAGLQMTIDRALSFEFTLYGKTTIARTQADTVGDMLKEKGISLSDSDKISVDQKAILSEAMNIRVWREGRQTITVDEQVDFEIEKIENADEEVGFREIRTVGVKGKRSVTYEVVIQDGKEVSKKEIASLTIQQPKKQVEAVGVKGKYTTPSENQNITWDFLKSKGFSRIQAAGIMGNLMQEHRFNTDDVPGGLGIAQWTGGRRINLMSMYPDSYTNIYSQLNYLMYELDGPYASVKSAILVSSSLSEVVEIFQNKFERCNPVYCMLDMRINYASGILGSHE